MMWYPGKSAFRAGTRRHRRTGMTRTSAIYSAASASSCRPPARRPSRPGGDLRQRRLVGRARLQLGGQGARTASPPASAPWPTASTAWPSAARSTPGRHSRVLAPRRQRHGARRRARRRRARQRGPRHRRLDHGRRRRLVRLRRSLDRQPDPVVLPQRVQGAGGRRHVLLLERGAVDRRHAGAPTPTRGRRSRTSTARRTSATSTAPTCWRSWRRCRSASGTTRRRTPPSATSGPTAQDFHAAFGLGEDPLRISTIDADGIALAGVQALAIENAALKAELASLRADLARIERELNRR